MQDGSTCAIMPFMTKSPFEKFKEATAKILSAPKSVLAKPLKKSRKK
jgi:hypothetical protein